MKSRLSAPSITFGIFLACCTGSLSALASESITFKLSNESGEPVSRVDFEPLPAGSVVPKSLGINDEGEPIVASPLTPLDSSEGVDIDNVFVLLGTDDSTPEGGPDQETLFLLFGFSPNPEEELGLEDPPFVPIIDDDGKHLGLLEEGGRFDFELNLADDDVIAQLMPATPGLDLLAVTRIDDLTEDNTFTDTGEVNVDGSNGLPHDVNVIPEPSTVLLWSALAGVGVIYARRRQGSPFR